MSSKHSASIIWRPFSSFPSIQGTANTEDMWLGVVHRTLNFGKEFVAKVN